MQLTEELIERDGLKIHYWTGGMATAPLVVFTHGATVDHHEWDLTLPLVAEHFRVLTWDVRGHGLSRPAPFVLRQAVDDLVAILDRVQVEQAVFIGHSMGRPIFKIYPYKTLVDQALALTATSKASQDILRPAMESLVKDEFVQIMVATLACLHFEPDYNINKPLLLMVGDQDRTGNIRQIMPVWAAHGPTVALW